MIGPVLATIVALMEAYLVWRAATMPAVRNLVPARWLLIGAAALWVLFYTGRFDIWTMEWIATLLITFLAVLAADIVSGFGLFMPRIAARLRGAALAGGLLFSAAAMVQGMRQPVVQEHEVYLEGLPAGLDSTVLAVVSDIHASPMTRTSRLEELAGRINGMSPDLIVLVGDILESHGSNYDELIRALETLEAPLDVWAVAGNHD